MNRPAPSRSPPSPGSRSTTESSANIESPQGSSPFAGAAAYKKDAEHHQIHENFIKTVDEIREDIRKTGVTNISNSVVAMTLANWLVNHISIQDKALGKHIASLG